MSVSEWCQIVTAAAASVSFIVNAYLRHKNYVYSAAKDVSTWLEDKVYPDNPPTHVCISNQSKTALYNVFVFMDLNTYECSLDEHLDRISELQNPYFYFETFPANKNVSRGYQPSNAAGGHHLIPAMLFTDTNGNYWYRTPAGKLVRLRETYMDELVKHAYVLGHVNA